MQKFILTKQIFDCNLQASAVTHTREFRWVVDPCTFTRIDQSQLSTIDWTRERCVIVPLSNLTAEVGHIFPVIALRKYDEYADDRTILTQ